MNTRFVRAAFAAATLFACGSPQLPLTQTRVPDGFKFQTSRSVPVSLTVDPSLVAAGFPASLEVRRPDGAVLFEGAVTGGATVSARLMVPAKDAKLVAVLHGDGADRSFDVAVPSTGAASATLR